MVILKSVNYIWSYLTTYHAEKGHRSADVESGFNVKVKETINFQLSVKVKETLMLSFCCVGHSYHSVDNHYFNSSAF